MAHSWGAVLPLGCLHGRAAPAPPLLLFSHLSTAARSRECWFRTLGHTLPHLQDFLLLYCPSFAPSPPRWAFQG